MKRPSARLSQAQQSQDNHRVVVYRVKRFGCHVPVRGLGLGLGPGVHLPQHQALLRLAHPTLVCRTTSTTTTEVKTQTKVRVRLCIQRQVPFGQELKVVGAGPELGEWQAQRALPLQWSEGHVWFAELELEPGSYEFKCVTVVGDSIKEWEAGPNRIVQVPIGVRGIRVDGSWCRTGDNRITVTEPIAAASSAARQKRAAAARLLTKALADVTAAAAASGPSAAAVSGRKQASLPASGSAVGGGAGGVGSDGAGSGSGGVPGSKAAEAEALEKEALRELEELFRSAGGSEASSSRSKAIAAASEAAVAGVLGGSRSGSSNGIANGNGRASPALADGSKKEGEAVVAAAEADSANRSSGSGDSAPAPAAAKQQTGSAGSKLADWRALASEEEKPPARAETSPTQSEPAAGERTKQPSRPEPQAKAQDPASSALAASIREAAVARGEPVHERSTPSGSTVSSSDSAAGAGSSGAQQQGDSGASKPQAPEQQAKAEPAVLKPEPKAAVGAVGSKEATAAAVAGEAAPRKLQEAVAAQEGSGRKVEGTADAPEKAAEPVGPAIAKSASVEPEPVPAAAEVQGPSSTAASGDGSAEAKASGAESPASVSPATARRGFRFASLREELEKEVGEAAKDSKGGSADKEAPAGRALSSASGSDSGNEDSLGTARSGSSSDSASSSSGGRRFSWRLAAEEEEKQATEAGKQGQAKQSEAVAEKKQEQQKEQQQPEEEEDASSRFARLLQSKLHQQGSKSAAADSGTKAATANTSTEAKESKAQQAAPSVDVKEDKPSQPVKGKEQKSQPAHVKGPIAAASSAAPRSKEAAAVAPAKAGAAATAPSQPAQSVTAAGTAAEPPKPAASAKQAPTQPSAPTATAAAAANPGVRSSSSKAGGAMGASASRADAGSAAADAERGNLTRSDSLDRLLDVWDAAWSRGGAKKAVAGESLRTDAPSDAAAGDRPAASEPRVNGAAAGSTGPAAANGAIAVASDKSPSQKSGLTAALGAAAAAAAAAANKLVNGRQPSTAAPAGSSGESLFDMAERQANSSSGGSGPSPVAPTVVPTSASDDASPDMTLHKGALAAMAVDRTGSFDNRSSYLSQSLLADSLSSAAASGSVGANRGEQASASLLRQLRAANAAAAAAAASEGAANASTEVMPPLPATPVLPGILSSTTDDEDATAVLGGVAPPLPATPPPPSYLSGPPPASAAATFVPPLPATPVPPSLLSGSLGATGGAAEDLLRRAADADKVLSMLRGNLPLTPVARGGRGGAAGPLSLVEADENDGEEGEEQGPDNGRGRRRGRRGAGASLGANQDAEEYDPHDPIIATRRSLADAAQAWDKTRAAFQALQQSAAGLGLSPNTLSESAARLLQQLPKPGDAAADGGSANGAAAAAPPLPEAVSQLASTLVSGLGSVSGTLTEQLLRKAGGAAAADAEADVAANGGAAANGTAANGLAGVANGLGGLLSSLVGGGGGGGGSSLPPGSLRLVAGAHMIPHVDKVEKGGEDAYFISRVGLGGVGVADGVSGWADEGIDPAEYPRTLMRYATEAYEAARGTLSAQDIIRYAQYRTYLKGSSTVCLALMKPGRMLEVANVGDSGVRILRDGKVIFGTEAQQHAFNMPYQLSHPNNVEDPDCADDADVHMVPVQEGDVIMLATDGLFDNVFDEEVEQIVSFHLKELAAAGRDKAPAAAAAAVPPPPAGAGNAAGNAVAPGAAAAAGRSGSGGARPATGLLSQSLSAAAAAAATNGAANGATGRGAGAGGQYRAEDAARVARALAERAHLHARNPTQRTPWSVTSSQQPNFLWAKFFAKGGGKMDDCTVLVAFVCGPE